jgi:hypothetical protein
MDLNRIGLSESESQPERLGAMSMTRKGIDRLVCNDLLGSMPWSVPGGLRLD